MCFRTEYSGRRVHGSGTVQNISLTGALIEEASPLLVAGGEICLRFPFFDDSLPVELRARVVRETPTGFAVHFEAVSARVRKVLTLAIARAETAGAPAGAALLEGLRARRS